MLTNMDFVSPGSEWVPKSEIDRLNKYEGNRNLFNGDHEKVFDKWVKLLREDQQATLEIVLNWHKRLSKLWADLLLGEPPRFKAGEVASAQQKAVTRIVKDNKLIIKAYRCGIDFSRFGDGIFKIRFDGKKVIIEAIDPKIWFPVVNQDNIQEIDKHVLAWDFESVETVFGMKKKVKKLKVEVHERGKITTMILRMDDRLNTIKEVESITEVSTKIDKFLVIPVNNIITNDVITGEDDYKDLDGIIQEMEIRIAQIARILDKHSDPSMYGPESALEQNEFGQWVFKGGGKFFPMTGDEHEVPPGYIVWNGQLDSAFKQLDVLMEQLYVISETSPAAFGQLKAGLAESGSALRRLMMASIAKVNRMRMMFDDALIEVIETAIEFEAVMGVKDALHVSELELEIEWQDGLPQDDKESTELEVSLHTAGLSSLESSLKRRFNLEGQALQDEIKRIQDDKKSNIPEPTPQGTLKLPPKNGQPPGNPPGQPPGNQPPGNQPPGNPPGAQGGNN